jgi:hypothetical protein
MFSTMSATEDFRFHTVPDHSTAAMLALRRQGMNRTFKAIKDMRLAFDGHLERFVIIISTYFALCHDNSPNSAPRCEVLALQMPDPAAFVITVFAEQQNAGMRRANLNALKPE